MCANKTENNNRIALRSVKCTHIARNIDASKAKIFALQGVVAQGRVEWIGFEQANSSLERSLDFNVQL
jgi:hypothetical protein